MDSVTMSVAIAALAMHLRMHQRSRDLEQLALRVAGDPKALRKPGIPADAIFIWLVIAIGFGWMLFNIGLDVRDFFAARGG